jgi:AraC-like DNA-binding protein/effector-binding domain-containing protein
LKQKRTSFKQIQPILAYAVAHLDEDVSLAMLAQQARTSPYHLHRLFSSTTGETSKQLTLRLRLSRAALMLLLSNNSVLDIALSCGFQSHEVFCRAFRRRFGASPRDYRRRGFLTAVAASQREAYASIVERVGPCVGLYHISGKERLTVNRMLYTVTKTQLAAQPVIVGRRRVRRSEIAATIGQVLPLVFHFAQQHGIALTGLPLTRYLEVGPGLLTIEPGMRVANSDQKPLALDPSWLVATGEVEVRIDTLPVGPAAFTLHTGPYDQLPDAYAAMQEWIEKQGLMPAGPPWESYVTDPAESPDPEDWKTELFWPLRD